MLLTQNWRSETSWLFKNEKGLAKLYEEQKKFVETGAVIALK